MGFWSNCNKCGTSVYMGKVTPPGEYYARWLPFEDEEYEICHIDNCYSARTIIAASPAPPKKVKVTLIDCPLCHNKLNPKNLKKHLAKQHASNNIL